MSQTPYIIGETVIVAYVWYPDTTLHPFNKIGVFL